MGDGGPVLAVAENPFAARLAAMQAAREAFERTPEGQAALARRAELERRTAEREARQAFEAFVRTCDERNVPAHPATRRLCAAPDPAPTAALEALRTALAWRKGRRDKFGAPPVTLVLAGRPGNGKTVTLSRSCARWTRPARYELARAIAATPDNDWSGNRERREMLGHVPMLALDELGLEESEKAGARIAGLLSERHDRGLVTIAATNLDVETFMGRYVTDRLVSRLVSEQGLNGAEGGLSWWWDLPDCDLRDPGNARALAERAESEASE